MADGWRRTGYTGGVCGETYDHDAVVTFEDDDIVQWMCRNCGAEGEENKDGSLEG